MYNDAIKQMLNAYTLKSLSDYENAFKEIIQQIALLALWRSKFFEHAAFYGGSALRILYGLDRFSEDLDFSLLEYKKNFSISKYKNAITQELESFGFEVEFHTKEKKVKSPIESAFLKANTLVHLLKVSTKLKTHKDARLQIKLEVDTNPPLGFVQTTHSLFIPANFSVVTMDLPSLFAGKMHAILCRERIKNVKGRDWYDLVWYLRRNTSINKTYLENKINDTNPDLLNNGRLTLEKLHNLFTAKVSKTNFRDAINDISPFLRTKEQIKDLDFWSEEYFVKTILPNLKLS